MEYGQYFVGLLIASASVTATVGIVAWRYRRSPGISWFIALMGLASVWAAVSAIGALTPDPELRLTIRVIEQSIGLWLPVLWVGFVFSYTGLEKHFTAITLGALSLIPAATVAAFVTTDRFGLAWVDASVETVGGLRTVTVVHGDLLSLGLAYSYLLLVGGTALLVWRLYMEPQPYWRQSAAFVVGISVPAVASFVSNVSLLPVPGLSVAPAALSITGIAFGYALFTDRLFEVAPGTRHAGETAAVEGLDDGVVILSPGGKILSVNPAAASLLGIDDPDTAINVSFDDLCRERFGRVLDGSGTVTRDGNRSYDVTTSPITDHAGSEIGRTLLFRDITELKLRKQRLQVLNRILRHNLRNDINIVKGYATTLVERLDGEERKIANAVRDVTDDLVELGEKVRRTESIMDREQVIREPVRLAKVVAETVEEVGAKYPTYRIETTLDERAIAHGDPRLLRTIVQELLDNAVEHGGGDGTVSVAVRRHERRVELVVADDGPGIPTQEREAILEGQETALRHGSGLGLWLVNWSVQQLDGTITFEDSTAGGSAVVVTVPAAHTEDETGAEK